MLKNIIIVWLLIAIFVGTRQANKFFHVAFGFIALGWVIKMIVGFGIKLLPLIIVIAIVTNVVWPFIKGFLDGFKKTRPNADNMQAAKDEVLPLPETREEQASGPEQNYR